MTKVSIYTDGACRGNPGVGGWGAVLLCNGKKKEMSGAQALTTNNQMELMGAIMAFEALKFPCDVDFYSDSSYVINGLEKGWAVSWKKNGWTKSDKKPALNPELWERLLIAVSPHKITYHWVKGHNGNEYNEICDTLATSAADAIK